ncbi:hypothetical protein EDD37DRAFT_501251 [Exophiala viscosa]|uniref:uncharacterized protein n=1 Tax=Exophiala viscosa TaxID=2486360 RepID=UPI0021924949|nr:hypothetical protein EDD37DRAFT_501251 [Exophiala viscosa]
MSLPGPADGNESSKSPLATASTNLVPADNPTSSSPLANDENLTLLPFKFRIELGMILVVDHQKITDNADYLGYMYVHDPDYERIKEDYEEEDEEGGIPMYQSMEETWGQRKVQFLQGIIELEGGLDVCVGNRCKHGYKTWHVYRDYSMDFPKKYEDDEETLNIKRIRLQEHANFDGWDPEELPAPLWVDSVGVSLDSPYLECPSRGEQGICNRGLDEVTKYLGVLDDNYDKPWQCLSIEEHGRVHVTIGLPSKDGFADIPLSVLQHLAYLVIKYEDVILLFTSPWRAGWENTNSEDVGSNRAGIVENGNHLCSKFSLGPLEDVKRKIFSKDMTPTKLLRLLHAYHYWNYWEQPDEEVNWTTDKFVTFGTKQVTFRQLHGTMDQIRDWVRFVTALMRLAERKAMEPVPTPPAIDVCSKRDWGLREGSKYNNVFGTKDERMAELLDLLEFSGWEKWHWIEYWKISRCNVSTEFKEYRNCPGCGFYDPADHKHYWRRRNYNGKRGDSVPPDDLDGNRRPRTPLPDPPNIDRDTDDESEYDSDGERIDDNDTNSAKSVNMSPDKDGSKSPKHDETHVQEEIPTAEDDLKVQDEELTGQKRKREGEGDATGVTDMPPAKCAREA